jgi:shikimate dehydrogenase
MKISARTKPFAVLGHPVAHTLSPAMHNAAFQSIDMDAVYLAFDVTATCLGTVLSGIRELGFGGLNLTVPLKQEAIPYLGALDPYAERLGAVNTVEVQASGVLKGHNTDGPGFLDGVGEAFGTTVTGRSVFVFGSGGAGRAVAITCAMNGAKRVSVADIDRTRAALLAEEISTIRPAVTVEAVEVSDKGMISACQAAELVVQATPIGLKASDIFPLTADAFRSGQLAYDLIYHQPETPFMKSARQSGAKTANGLGMLLHQGARAFTIWTGKPAPIEVMRGALTAEIGRA